MVPAAAAAAPAPPSRLVVPAVAAALAGLSAAALVLVVGTARPDQSGLRGEEATARAQLLADMAAAAGGHRRLAAAAPQSATTTTLPPDPVYDDVVISGCTPGRNCSTTGGMPPARGICVDAEGSGTGNACWDVCNPKHLPQDYTVAAGPKLNPAVNIAFAGIVAEVRAGDNSFVNCPGTLKQGDRCPPGKYCPKWMSHKFKIPQGRGMCVNDPRAPNSRACWDMCDMKHKPADYVLGTASGAESIVWNVRRGGCPSAPWWPWVLCGVLIVLILACCVVFVVMQRMGKHKKSRGMGAPRLENQVDFNQDFLEPAGADREFRDEVEDYSRADYREELPAMPEPPAPAVMDDAFRQQDFLPPEPPRDLIMDRGAPRVDSSLFDKIDVNHDGRISREEYDSFFPGGGSKTIPGLDEPNLLFPGIQPQQSMQPGYFAQNTAVAPPPDLLSQAMAMPPLSASQPQVQPVMFNQVSNPAPTFQTQLPSAFAAPPRPYEPVSGVTQPASVQLRPGAMTSFTGQPGGAFFTQLVRR